MISNMISKYFINKNAFTSKFNLGYSKITTI